MTAKFELAFSLPWMTSTLAYNQLIIAFKPHASVSQGCGGPKIK